MSKSMPHLTGQFQERNATLGALRKLKQSGYAPKDVDVYSPAPLEIPREVLERRSHASLVAVLGAIFACLAIVGFVYFAQHDYPIVTGGMPIFSFWSTGVVFYEVTMLGATLSSLLWFAYDSGLLRRGGAPVFFEGIQVRVRCSREQAPDLRAIFESAGAANIQWEDKQP